MPLLRLTVEEGWQHCTRSGSCCAVQIPRNFKIIAVPLFDLYENSSRYGAILASLPGLISRFRLTLAGASLSPADVEAKEEEASERQSKQ